MDQFLTGRYLGLPPIADYVKAGLWIATGRPEGGNLFNILAIAIFGIYLWWSYRLSLIWSVLIFIAVPTLHTNLESQYVDLWSNAFFSLFLLAMFRGLRTYPIDAPHSALGLVFLCVAAGSKMQLAVIGAVAIGIFGLRLLTLAWCNRQRVTGMYVLGLSAVTLMALPIVFFVPVTNTVRFNNPIYPVSVSIAGVRLPGPEPADGAYNQFGPSDIRKLPEAARYFLSQLEYRALSNRPGAYTIGQGDVQDGSEGDRMGGSLAVLLVLATCCLGYVTRIYGRAALFPLTGGAVVVSAVAMFPGSYDLRYFSFVEIVMVTAVFILLGTIRGTEHETSRGLLLGVKFTLIGSAIFVSLITGLNHVLPPQADHVAIITGSGIRRTILDALQSTSTICYARKDHYAILYSNALNVDVVPNYTLFRVTAETDCPKGSVILR